MSEHHPDGEAERQENSVQPVTPAVSTCQAETRERSRPQLALSQQRKRPEDHPVIQEIARLFNASIAEKQRMQRDPSAETVVEATLQEQEVLQRLSGHGGRLATRPCLYCACRLVWMQLGEEVCARCEPGGLWSNASLDLLQALGKERPQESSLLWPRCSGGR